MNLAFPPILRTMARDRRLTATDIQVFLVASEFLDFVELRPLKGLMLSRETGLDPSHVARALRRLVQAGYLETGPRAGVGAISTFRILFSRGRDTKGG